MSEETLVSGGGDDHAIGSDKASANEFLADIPVSSGPENDPERTLTTSPFTCTCTHTHTHTHTDA